MGQVAMTWYHVSHSLLRAHRVLTCHTPVSQVNLVTKRAPWWPTAMGRVSTPAMPYDLTLRDGTRKLSGPTRKKEQIGEFRTVHKCKEYGTDHIVVRSWAVTRGHYQSRQSWPSPCCWTESQGLVKVNCHEQIFWSEYHGSDNGIGLKTWLCSLRDLAPIGLPDTDITIFASSIAVFGVVQEPSDLHDGVAYVPIPLL